MITKNKQLSSGLEDYLETIYIAHIKKQPLKGAELARQLNISRASVSEALSKLVAKKLIKYDSYKEISITEEGKEQAIKIYNKHNALKHFFEEIIGVEKKEAEENACKIEHIISQNVFDKISDFTQFCRENPEIINKYKKLK